MSKTKNSKRIKIGFRLVSCLFLACLLILSQGQILMAFEAHVINVTAKIVNDVPDIDPPGGEFCNDGSLEVTLSTTLANADIIYTTDSSDPVCYDSNGTVYSGPFSLTTSATVKARTCHDGDKQSAIMSEDYDVSAEYCPFVCDPELELMLNGGFEEPIVGAPQQWDIFVTSEVPGWNIVWMPGLSSYGGYDRPVEANLELHRGVLGPAAEGDQYAELDTDWYGPGHPQSGEPASVEISQDITTEPGQEYTVKFSFSPRPNTNQVNNVLEFRIDGVVKDTVSGAGGGSNNWTEYSYTFTATSNTTNIQFADLGTSDSLGTFLDKISTRCVPPEEPEPCDVVLNEILPNPECSQDEFVELYNNCGQQKDLTDWYLGDGDPNNPVNTIPISGSIGGNSWFVVYFDSHILNNTGDTITLYNNIGSIIDSYTFGSSSNDTDSDEDNTPGSSNSFTGSEDPGNEGKSYARIPDGTGSWVDPIPTPGAPNRLESLDDEEDNFVELTPEETFMVELTPEEGGLGSNLNEESSDEIEESSQIEEDPVEEEPIDEEIIDEEVVDEEITEEAPVDTGSETGEEIIEEIIEEIQEVVEEIEEAFDEVFGDEPVDEPLDEPINEPTDEPVEPELTDEPVEDTADEPVVSELTEEPDSEPVEEPVEIEPTGEPADEIDNQSDDNQEDENDE